ncbi:MAG: glutaredoxin family protein [Planctomycetaceae bacterium]|nr:glutaredoxin family protein [Planctomycetaceae bacterium]
MTQDITVKRVNSRIGGALLFTAAALSCLIFADRWTNLPLRMPGVWYETRGLHVLFCVALYIGGWLALRNTSDPAVIDDETLADGPLYSRVTFYTRPGCCLCDEAMELLTSYRQDLPEIETVNIEDDQELTERFGESIPVIELDGRVMFQGRISAALLDRTMQARRRQRSVSEQQER